MRSLAAIYPGIFMARIWMVSIWRAQEPRGGADV
jgi:hypothetical protein